VGNRQSRETPCNPYLFPIPFKFQSTASDRQQPWGLAQGLAQSPPPLGEVASVLHTRGVPLQQGLEAGMVAEGGACRGSD
jgi:hypothetical protein